MSIFSKIQLRKPKRTVFNMSYSSKLSLPFGRLVPIMCEKVVPGDKFVHSHEFLMRFAPFYSQVFQQFKVVVDYFFVPSRIIWNDFEKFLVDNDNLYVHPFASLDKFYDGEHSMQGTLLDYFNLPSGDSTNPIDGSGTNVSIDILPFAAYLKIFLDYYADENLTVFNYQNTVYDYNKIVDLFEVIINRSGSSYFIDLYRLYSLINRGVYPSSLNPSSYVTDGTWNTFVKSFPKDYFTSALPFAQRGPIVQIPLNGSGDVIVQAQNAAQRYQGVVVDYASAQGGTVGQMVDVTLKNFGKPGSFPDNTGDFVNVPHRDGSSAAAADLAGLQDLNNREISFKAVNVNGTATITDLRTAMAVQSWLEKNARAGVRYKEQLARHFGVRSRDYRLDRAELLQRSRSTVSIGEVFTTAQNDDSTFVPGLGVSTATGSNAVKPFKHFFPEHGYVIGLMCVYPVASYHQGVPRQFLELDKYDYFWPEFQHIGEQDIKRVELFLDDNVASNNSEVFGYTPRYAQYKSRVNQVHGDFRDQLRFMTDGREFQNNPLLNKEFIDIDVQKNNLYRVFNDVSVYSDTFPCFVDFFHNFKAIRPMSYFGNPRII